MLMAEDEREAARMVAEFRAAIRSVAGPGRVVVDDGDARAWMIVPGADRDAARALAASVAGAVRAAPEWRGAPMLASVGVAVLGEDGDDAEVLLDAAERSMLAAAAGGTEI
jgi:GGDEF domain-containing protein